ncbi:D-amino-acid transaminase [Evansella sp. LMS18]|uniref:D-amino-acid transaminase n=1 Tax=Evansella sp. LMS18 TaxID=2924033 RepID=UPI0020D15EA1|nr:D-amino-acid transaminase [Evansella sp. LMS18]UTR12104.1 D-amino-acid transaminase [Evansella sp. LMS18]
MEYVLYNEDTVPRSDVNADIEDRGYQFGDGVYEVIRVFNGKCFMMEEHLERLERSASEIRLSLSYSVDELTNKLEELCRHNSLKEGIIYVQITRGTAPRAHEFPGPEVLPCLTAYTKELKRPLELQKKGVRVSVGEDIRWLRCDIKSLNLLGNVLGKQKAADEGSYELIQHRDGSVTEGSATNTFIVKNSIQYTHPANNLILNGITRQLVLKLCRKLNLQVVEEAFTVDSLMAADEVFITSTTNDIMPVVKVGDTKVGTGIPGPMTLKLQMAYDEVITPVSSAN